MSTQFDHVSVTKKANVYFDGKCISYKLVFPDQSTKTIGVILPSLVTFTTTVPEILEIVEGRCRARVGEGDQWKTYEKGQRLHVPGNAHFDIEALEPVHYVCHFST
jgi:uncharacterized protein YaiE (UPF0345 family)